MSQNYYPFTLEPLPYAYDALEPYINRGTMMVHHDRLLAAYVEKLNAAMGECPSLRRYSLTQLLKNPWSIPEKSRTAIIDFGGGVENHNFFFASMRAGDEKNAPTGQLAKAIAKQYGSFGDFKKEFKNKAMSVFGSGWLWLVKDNRRRLSLVKTANQDSPLSLGLTPLIVIDVWEHAYFLQYLNLRDEYIENWFAVADWAMAEKRFLAK